MPDCPQPTRARYATEGAAWGALRGTPDRMPYRCPCGAWHLAPTAEARAKRAAGRP
jgi:hypothetical protein